MELRSYLAAVSLAVSISACGGPRLALDEVRRELDGGRNLTGRNLSGLDLIGLDFRNAILRGAYFRDANLDGVDLTAADLSKSHLEKARLVGATLRGAHRLPAMFGIREAAEAGGLLSYGPDYFELGRRSATYVDRILKGAKPADLPVEQPTQFELVVNLRTAKALGLTVPQSIVGRANRIIA